MNDDSHPACSRLLGLSARFCRQPELAPDLAALFERHGGLGGLPWDWEHFRALEVVDPTRLDRPFIDWDSETMSPVDQALAWGSEEGARALLAAGFTWDPEPFLRHCAETISAPERPWPHLLSPSIAIAERLALEAVAPSAQLARAPRL